MTGPMTTDTNPIVIGTRESPLAMVQTETVAGLLKETHEGLAQDGMLQIDAVKTTGDIVLDRPLSEIGGKGLFTKELDRALMDRRVDIAVHSMKDLETWLPEGMAIGCILPREDPRDAFIGAKVKTMDELPTGARVGTASLRRQAQLLAMRPDLDVDIIRGNVQTRLKKLAAGEYDATFLALAGLLRMGMEDVATQVLGPETLLPACAQGAVGVTCRADDTRTLEFLKPLDHGPTHTAVMCERAMLDALDGSCRTPIAGLAEIDGEEIHLRGLVARIDGTEILRGEQSGRVQDAEDIGRQLGEDLKSRAGPDFFPQHE
jgi:hydroxymethylbilane synthase